MAKAKDPLDKLTKHEKSRVLPKLIGEENEKIIAMGQENEHAGAHWVKEVGKEDRLAEKQHTDDVMEQLTDTRQQIMTYKAKLIEEMKREMTHWQDELPKGYTWSVESTDKGIVLWVRSDKKEYFAKGLILSHDPKYDLNGVARMIVAAVQLCDDQTKQTASGIILST